MSPPTSACTPAAGLPRARVQACFHSPSMDNNLHTTTNLLDIKRPPTLDPPTLACSCMPGWLACARCTARPNAAAQPGPAVRGPRMERPTASRVRSCAVGAGDRPIRKGRTRRTALRKRVGGQGVGKAMSEGSGWGGWWEGRPAG
jgi:hypothetical protein